MKHDRNIEERYFRYLCRSIGIEENSPMAMWDLARQFYRTIFAWVIPDDANRVEDAFEMREAFVAEHFVDRHENWVNMDISVLEFFVALTRRCSFIDQRPESEWFLIFIDNLGITQYLMHEDISYHVYDIDDILAGFMYRSYLANGVGGIFPLRKPKKDQRKVSIWDQMSAYIIEEMELLDALNS